ncbi:MAG: transcription termination/antitermination protein NusG [Pirellulaceae bacterium]|jgi:transcriptional antiterminator NusG|nr:transcription termination/antitermination protein NusG [Pirellulaceae bacterium]
MVAEDPTTSDATGLPVSAIPPTRDQAEAGEFVPQQPDSDPVRPAGSGDALTPENNADDVVMTTEEEGSIGVTDPVEMEQAADEGKPGRDDSQPSPELDDVPESSERSMPEAAEAPEEGAEGPAEKEWYILKVQVNREDSIRAALLRRIKIEGLEEFFDEIVVPTEEVAEFNKSGKRKVVRRKLYPGYILVHMVVNDDTWFVVRETPGVGDFTGSSGKPTPMNARDVERILRLGVAQEDRGGQIKTAIAFKVGDRVRVKDGHFQNFEGEVDSIDEANGRITVMINIFNRSTPVELEHWQVESV